jgi:hypothetical protein
MPQSDEHVAPPEAPAAEEKSQPRTYSEAEVEKRLRGQSKELERLQSVAAEFEKVKAEQAKKNQAEAAKRGEFERLYSETQTRAKELEALLEKERSQREGYESLLSSEVNKTLETIEDANTRKRWTELVASHPVLEQRRILQELIAAYGGAAKADPKPPKTAPAGKRSGDFDFDPARTARDAANRHMVALDYLRRAKEGLAGE